MPTTKKASRQSAYVSGIRRLNGLLRATEVQMIRAEPTRLASFVAIAALTSAAAEPTEKIMPVVAGLTPTVSTRNRMFSAFAAVNSRLDTALVAAMRRSTGLVRTNRTPSRASASIPRRSVTAGAFSGVRTCHRQKALATKLSASASSAFAAPASCTSHPPTPGPTIWPPGADRLHGRVALHEVVAAHDRRQVGLVADLEDDPHQAGHGRRHDQQRERQPVGRRGHGDRDQHERAHDVRPDEQRTAAPAVQPDAGGQPDHEERGGLDRAEHAELERRRVQQEHRDQRERDPADLGAHLGHRLAERHITKIPVTPEPGLVVLHKSPIPPRRHASGQKGKDRRDG
jgi:hypothetical protein